MRFVEIRTPEQIDLQALHRICERMIARRIDEQQRSRRHLRTDIEVNLFDGRSTTFMIKRLLTNLRPRPPANGMAIEGIRAT